MSDVKLYTFSGAAGCYVYESDYKKLKAESESLRKDAEQWRSVARLEKFEDWWFSGNYPFRVMDRLEEEGISEDCAQYIWQASRAHEFDLIEALKAITNSGPDAIPIKEAFEMAHRAIERASGGKV